MRRALAVFVLIAGTPPGAAQAPRLSVTLGEEDAPVVRTSALLDDGQFVALLRSGFPLRLHYRLELWRVRRAWFDQFQRDVAWDAVARHDPLADHFVLIRSGGSVTVYRTPEELARAIAIPYRVALGPGRPGRFYYTCRLEVTTLDDSDLAELERWLHGDAGPAVSGEGDVGGALARGLQRLFVRIAGLPRLTLEARSGTFAPAR